MSDAQLIKYEIARAMGESREISHGCARTIAAGYHDGRIGATIAFTSTGAITDTDLYGLLTDNSALYLSGSADEREALNWLGTYLVNRIVAGDVGPVDGWADMWAGK